MTGQDNHPSKSTPLQWAKALTAREAQGELGPLQTVADVERWLERIPLMARTGRLRSKQVTASLLSQIHVWCRKNGRGHPADTITSIENRLAAIVATTSGNHRVTRHPPSTPPASTHPQTTRVKEQRIRQRRRLANRRGGNECRSGEDRRQARRRQRNTDGRRAGHDRRCGDRRVGVERRTKDRRGAA
jgi:hypothetical protein